MFGNIETLKVKRIELDYDLNDLILEATNKDWLIDSDYTDATRLVSIDDICAQIAENAEDDETSVEDRDRYIEVKKAFEALATDGTTHVAFIYP